MQEIKAIVFDFGGVFSVQDDLGDIGRHLAKKYHVSRKAVDEITLRGWLMARVNPQADTLFWRELANTLGISVAALKREYLLYPRFVPEMAELARALRRRYVVGMLTNQIETWHRMLMRRWKLTRLFKPIISSYAEGVAKPDPRIYARLLRDLRLPAKACIYVDDRPDNLKPAAALGMQTVHFKSSKQLLREFRQRGIS